MEESQSLTTYQNQVLLTDIIAPSFYSVHWDILEGKHTYYDLTEAEAAQNPLLSVLRYHWG